MANDLNKGEIFFLQDAKGNVIAMQSSVDLSKERLQQIEQQYRQLISQQGNLLGDSYEYAEYLANLGIAHQTDFAVLDVPDLKPQTLPDESISQQTAVYFVMRTERTDKGWIPLIAVKGETGYYKTNWTWDCTYEEAQALVDKLNLQLGYMPREAYEIQLSTMELHRHA